MKTIIFSLTALGGLIIGIGSASVYYKVKSFEVNSKMFAEGAREVLED